MKKLKNKSQALNDALSLGEACLELAAKLEAPGNIPCDITPYIEKLRGYVIRVIDILADYDGDPRAKAMLDKLNKLMEWWLAQPRNVGVGCC